ncbi:MAG TPA: MFS transporter, partial [Thermomicrobiales bacterium]|nr:MFS transporter [Thermomicrobiales bacterium]
MAASTLAFVTRINIYGFGLRVFWIVTNVILLPNRVEDTVQVGLHGTALGLIAFLGVGLAAFVQPIAGRTSDAWPGTDKRRPFIIAGTCVALPGLLIFGGATHAGVVLAGFVSMQLGANIAQAAFQAFIPDLVPREHRGLASGVKNILAVLGSALGLLGGEAILLLHGSTGWVIAYIGAVLALTTALTLVWVPRIPGETAGSWQTTVLPAMNPRKVWREAVTMLRRHTVFRRAVLAQFLFVLGTYPSERFLVLFLKARFADQVHQIVAIGGVAAIAIAILAAGVAGSMSDRIGRPKVLTVATICGGTGMVLVGLSTTIPLLMVAGSLI